MEGLLLGKDRTRWDLDSLDRIVGAKHLQSYFLQINLKAQRRVVAELQVEVVAQAALLLHVQLPIQLSSSPTVLLTPCADSSLRGGMLKAAI